MHDPVRCNESGADIAYALVDLADTDSGDSALFVEAAGKSGKPCTRTIQETATPR